VLKWSSTIIFVIVTIATIGLMLIQVYWIRDAVKVKQAVFLREVQQSMGQVVFNLDKMMIEERLNKQRKNYMQQKNLKVIRDSLNQLLFNGLENINSQTDLDILLQSTDKANKALSQLTVNFSKVDAASYLLNKKELINTQIKTALAKRK